MNWPSWLACLCDLWQPTPEKQGILACTPSSGPFLSPPIKSQPQLRTRPIEYLCALLAPRTGAPPPPYGPGQLHHDAASINSAPSIIEQADARHKERKERQRVEADKTKAARNKITSVYGSRMLKVGLVSHQHSLPPTPTCIPDIEDKTPALLSTPHYLVSDYFDEADAHSQPLTVGGVDPRPLPHLSYGTFGTFATSHTPTAIAPPENGHAGLGIGFPTGLPSTPKPRRPSRPLHGLTVQVPAVPLESVRRHVAEMLFNIRGEDTDDTASHAPSSPLMRTDSRYSVESRRTGPSIDSPTSVRFPGVVVTPAESEITSVTMSMDLSTLNIEALATPITPKTPANPAYNFANHPSIEPPLTAAAKYNKYRRSSDDTPRQYRLENTPRPRYVERAHSDTPPPRGRQRTRGGSRSRRDSISTHTDDTEDGMVVYKQIGLSGLLGRRRHGHRKKVRIEE